METNCEYKAELFVIREEFKQLQAENNRLNTIIDNRAEDKVVLGKYQQLQAENGQLKKALGFLKTTLLHSRTLSEKEFVALKDIIDKALKGKCYGKIPLCSRM